MHSRTIFRRSDFQVFIACVLALALAVRVVAMPLVMAAPAPGLMAICSGGQIIYISMEDGQPVDGEDAPESVSCPFFGVSSALVVANLPMQAPAPVARNVKPGCFLLAVADAPQCSNYLSRAPPALI